jgi:hypothetical protein
MYWHGPDGDHPVSLTALAGMAFLMEGSTLREGKYRDEVRGATEWLMQRAQPNGLIGSPDSRSEGGRYMYGHGFALLFLSCIVGDEDNVVRRVELVRICEKAAKYCHDAQTHRGGWGYLSAKEGDDFDEGSVTVTQLQALRAARNAGIVVPADAIKKAQKYLKDCTNHEGGIIYSKSLSGGEGRPALTAAAVCCGFSAGDYDSPMVKKWLAYGRPYMRSPSDTARLDNVEYLRYYQAQAVYALGDTRWRRLFTDEKEEDVITWTVYRDELYDDLMRTQRADGSWYEDNWAARRVGAVYVTAVYLAVMQLDKGCLPIYQR